MKIFGRRKKQPPAADAGESRPPRQRKKLTLPKLRKQRLIMLIVAAALALTSAGLFIAYGSVADDMPSQEAASRFSGGTKTRFAQVSVFFTSAGGKKVSDIYSFRTAVDEALVAASLDVPENGSLWKDAYSATSSVTVTGDRGSATAVTIGVGGDWFYFHPLRLRSGNYITEADLMHDEVLIDENLAWQLFGSADLAGMEVTINGTPFRIAGVVAREDDFADKKAYTDGSGMFMHYDVMNSLAETPITTYELVCVDPISNFALDLVKTSFKDAATVQNSGRFSVSSILKVIGSFGTRSMESTGIELPYWENAARLVEDTLALLLVLGVAAGLFPAVCLVIVLIRLLIRGKRKLFGELVPEGVEKLSDNVRERQRLRLVAKERRRDEEWKNGKD